MHHTSPPASRRRGRSSTHAGGHTFVRRPYDVTWRSAPVTKLSNRASLESRRHGNVGHNEMESRPVGSAWCGRVVVSVARGCTAGLSTDAETSFRRRRPPGGRRARLAEHYRRQSRRTHKPTKCSLRRADWRTLMSTPQVVVVAAVFFGQIFPLLLLLLKLSRTAEYVPCTVPVVLSVPLNTRSVCYAQF